MSTQLPEGWDQTTLGEVCADVAIGPFGSKLKSELYTENGVPVARGQNLKESPYIDDSDIVCVSEQTARRLDKSTLQQGDLVFPHRGAIGRVSLVKDRTWLMSSSMMRARPLADMLVPLFGLYYFRGLGCLLLMTYSSSVGTPGIAEPLRSLRSIPVNLPPLWEQEAIAEVLGSLDDKIESNIESSEDLRAMSESAYAYSLGIGSSAESLSTLTQLISRGKAPKYVQEDGTTVLNQKCIRDERVNPEFARLTETNRLDPQRSLLPGDILVNSTGVGTLGRVAVWNDTGAVTVDSHVTIVRADPSRVSPWVLGEAVIAGQRRIEAMAEGSTGQTELSKSILGTLEVLVPTCDDLGETIRCCRDLETQLQKENRVLAELRDTLLGPLVSGRLRVKDAEKMVGDVL